MNGLRKLYFPFSAKGCPTADSLDAQYLQQAYEIGKRVGMEAPD